MKYVVYGVFALVILIIVVLLSVAHLRKGKK